MLQNLHTHTTFCDGNNTPEEMVKKAIELGFDSLGFSGHAPTSLYDGYEMEDTDGYISCINDLKSKYKGSLEIFLGVELDYYSAGLIDTTPFDYKIGSVHTSLHNGSMLYYDLSAERTKKQINELFGGDGAAFAKTYYERTAELPFVMDYDIVGHFDIVTKFSEKHPELIDTDSRAYRNAALDALHTVIKKAELFEVNTGAIGRGYRASPYPAPFILDEMQRLGAKLIISSDCHSAAGLDTHFKEAREYIKAHGFDTLYYLTENGFAGEKI